MALEPDAPAPDEQDQSEVFDEDNLDIDDAGSRLADNKTLEEIPDVYDVTSRIGDADDDVALIAENMDEGDIIDLDADAALVDFEDDELAARMPEQLHHEAVRGRSAGAEDEAPLVLAGDLSDVAAEAADPSSLEAERLSDRALAELDYAQDAPSAGATDRRPTQPTRFHILLRDGVWALLRDGKHLHNYGHAARAIHEAAELARELRRTGAPAVVYLHPASGKVVEVTDDDLPPAVPGAPQNQN